MRNLSLAFISFVIMALIFFSLSVSSESSFSKKSIACMTERSQISIMLSPPTVTASTVSFSLRPLQTGHVSSVISSLIFSFM